MHCTRRWVSVKSTPSDLLVMTWNIKHGGARAKFFYECGVNRYLLTEQEILDNMAAIAAKIRQADPDIVLLQEVDVECTRSAYVDQVQLLLDQTDLNHGASNG